MRCLAVDPATVSGYAFGEFGKRPMSGTIRLPDAGDPPARFCLLEGRLMNLISANKVEHLIIEDIYAQTGPKFSPGQAHLLHGYRTAIEMAAHKCGLDTQRDMTKVMPDAWRKPFGTNDVPPIVRRSSKEGAVRQWKKKAAFDRCLELGWTPRNLDEADALGIWAYAEALFEPFLGGQRLPLLASATL